MRSLAERLHRRHPRSLRPQPNGWRYVVAWILGYWYGLLLIVALVLCLCLWIWLLRTSPDEEYGSCLQREAAGWARTPVAHDETLRNSLDVTCTKPKDLTQGQALEMWHEALDEANASSSPTS